MIVATVGSKGGTMKTTITTHEASWLSLHGWDTVFVDCDKQRLGYRYLDEVGAKFTCLSITDPEEVYEELPKLAGKHDIVVVDGPGGLNDTTGAILHRADIVLVPTPPGYMCIQGTEWTANTIKEVQGQRDGLPQAGIIATRYKEGQKVYSNIRNVAKSLHFGFVEPGIPELAVITTARGTRNAANDGWKDEPHLIWDMGKSKIIRTATAYFDSIFRKTFPEACESDPKKILKMVTPRTRWHEIVLEDYDTRIAANS